MENRRRSIKFLSKKTLLVILIGILMLFAVCFGAMQTSVYAAGEGKNKAVESGNLGNATVGDILRFEITYNGYASLSDKITTAHTVKLVGTDSSVDPDLTSTSTSTTAIMEWIDEKRQNGEAYTDCEIGINFAPATASNHISNARMYINDAFVFSHGKYTFKNPKAAVTAQYDSLPKISPLGFGNDVQGYRDTVFQIENGATVTVASPFIFEGVQNSTVSIITIAQGGVFTVACDKEGYHEDSSGDYIGGVFGNGMKHPTIDNSGTINYNNAEANAFKFGDSYSTSIKNSGTLNITGQIVLPDASKYTTFADKIQVETTSVINLNNLPAKVPGYFAFLNLNFAQTPDTLVGKTIINCDSASADIIRANSSAVKLFFNGGSNSNYALQVDGVDGKIVLNKKYNNVFEISGKDNSYTLKRQYTKIVGGDGTTYSEIVLTNANITEILADIKDKKTETPTIHFGENIYSLYNQSFFSYSVTNGTIVIDFDCIIKGDPFFLGTDGNSPVLKFASGITVTSYANFYFGVGDGMTVSITDATRNSCGYMQNEGTFIIRQGKYQTGSIDANGIFTRYNDNNLLLIKNSGKIQIDFLEDKDKYLKIFGYIERSDAAAIVEIKNQGDYNDGYGITQTNPIKVLVPYGTPIKDITPFAIGEGIQSFPYDKTFNTYNKIYVATSSTEKVYFSSTYEPKVTIGSDGNITAGKTVRYTTKKNIFGGSTIGDTTAPVEFAIGNETTLDIEDIIYHDGVAYVYAGMYINGTDYSVGKIIGTEFTTSEDFAITFYYDIATFHNKFEVKKATDGSIEFYAHITYQDIKYDFRDGYFLVCSDNSFANAFEVLPILEDKTKPIQLIFDNYTDDIDLDLSYSSNKRVALSGTITGAVTIHYPLYCFRTLAKTVAITLGDDFNGDILVYNATNFISTDMYSFTLSGGYGTATDSDGNIVKGIWTEDYTSYQISNTSGGNTFDYAVQEKFDADGLITRYKVLSNVADVNSALKAIKDLNNNNNGGGLHTIYLGTDQSGLVAIDYIVIEFHNNAILQGNISTEAVNYNIAKNATVVFDSLTLDEYVNVLEGATLKLQGATMFGTDGGGRIYISGAGAKIEDIGFTKTAMVAIDHDLDVGYMFVKTDYKSKFTIATLQGGSLNALKTGIYNNSGTKGYYIGLKDPFLLLKSEGITNSKVVFGDTWSITGTPTISGVTNLPNFTYSWEYSVGGSSRIKLTNTGATISKAINLTVGKHHTFYCKATFAFEGTTSTSTEMKVSFLVTKKAITVGAPTYSGAELAFGESLANVSLVNNSFSQYGSYKFVDGQFAQGGTHAYNWIFEPNSDLLTNYEFQNVTGTIQLTAAERVYHFNYVIEQIGGTFTITDFYADKDIHVTVASGITFTDVISKINTDAVAGMSAQGLSQMPQINIQFGDGTKAIAQSQSFVIPEGNKYNYLITGKTEYTATGVAIFHYGTGTLTLNADISSSGWAISNKENGTVKIIGGTITSSGNTTVYNEGSGTVSLEGGTVRYTGSNSNNYGISHGSGSDFNSKIELHSGTVISDNTYAVAVFRNVTLFGDVTLTSAAGNAQFYVGTDKSLTVNLAYTTINNQYTLCFETTASGSVAVNGTTDTAHFAVKNDGYEFAADMANNQLNLIKSRTYYYNYTITKDGANFVITDTSPDGTDVTEIYRGMETTLGTKIDNDRKNADGTYNDCTITFGIGGVKLDLDMVIFNCSNGNYLIKGSVISQGESTIIASSSANVTIDADINNTNTGSYGSAIGMTDSSNVTIIGGTISATKRAICHEGIGLLTVSQGNGKKTLITSATEGTATDGMQPGTIYIMYNINKPESQLFSMTGGRVENSNSTSGVAILKQCNGTISISGGEISAISTALYVSALGETTISGGTFTSDSTEKTIIANDDNLTISGGTITQNGTGYAVWFFGGQSVSKQLSITDCPSINGIIFVRRGIYGAGYTGGLVKIDFTKWMIQDGAVVVYGSTDLSKWELTTPGYALISDSENGNLIAKASVKATFDMGGVLDNSEEWVKVGSKITKPASPTAIGFEFGGWYADAGYVSKFDFNTTLTNATTIYAKWTLGFADVSGKMVETTYDGKTHDLTVAFNTQNDKITYTYQWYLDGKIVSGWTTQSVSYINATSATEYTCNVTATFGEHFTKQAVKYIVIVKKAKLTVTANAQTIKFGEPISQTSYTISGFLGSDNIDSVSGKPILTENATTVAGGNAIKIDVSGMRASNYTFIGESGVLKINKADYASAPSHTEITGTYDKNKTLADYNLNANFRWKTPTEKPTVATTSYNAYYNADPANYNDFSVSILLKLSKQKITVPVIDSKIYNGQPQTAELAANEFFTVAENNGGKDAGADYAVKLTLNDFTNTEWDAEEGLSGTNNEILTLSFEIKKRAVTVTITDQRSAQGSDLADLTAPNAWNITVGSLVAGDDLGITLSTAADKNTVEVTAITGTAANTNYQVTFVNGNYSVYSVAGFNNFMADYGMTIQLTPGEITYAQVSEIIAMYLAYEGLDEDSLSQFAEMQKDSIAVLKIKADCIIKAKTAAETALNALNGFTAENIRTDGISIWKQKITDAEQAVSAFTQLSTKLSLTDLVGHSNTAAAKTLTDNYDSALAAVCAALASLKDKTAQGIVNAIYTRAELQSLVDTAKEKKEVFYASGGTAANLSDIAEIARVEEALRVYDSYGAFLAAHGTVIQMAVQQLAYADLTAIDAMVLAFGGLNEKEKSLLTDEQRTNISELATKSSEIQSAKSAAEAALAAIKDITATGIRNNAPTFLDAQSLIASATDKVSAYLSFSSGLTEGDLADYGNIAAAVKAVADYKAYKAFADSNSDIYAKDPRVLTYAESIEVNKMYAAFLLLTEDVKSVLTEEEAANIAALKEKANTLDEKKKLADQALAALNGALLDSADKKTLQDLLVEAQNKTEDFFSENGNTQSLPSYNAIEDTKNQISEYEKQEFENQVNEDLGAIEDFTTDVVGGMDIPSLDETIDKVQNAIDKIDASSDKTKEELAAKREELLEVKDNLTKKMNLEKTKVAAIEELKAEREELLASSAYSDSAKNEIAEYYENAIKQITLANSASAITENKETCIEKMKEVEILHVGLLIANLIFLLLLIGEILFLILRKKQTAKKKDTKVYSSILPVVILAAASGLAVGVTFLVILILAVVILGIYIADKLLRELRGKTVFSPVIDFAGEIAKKCTVLTQKLFGKKSIVKAKKAIVATNVATSAVQSSKTANRTATAKLANGATDVALCPKPVFQSKNAADGDDAEETLATIDEEEREVFKGIESLTGLAILVRYKKSFQAKLIQSPDKTKRYYRDLKNALLSYRNLTSRVSWFYDSINLGRTNIAKLSVRGKSLYLYLALSPDDYVDTKYKVERTEQKKYKTTACLYKITNDRRAKFALELIGTIAETFALTADKTQTVDYISENPYDTTESLIGRGLIKELISKENYETYKKRQSKQELEGKKRKFVSANEVSSLLSDEVAATLVDYKKPSVNVLGTNFYSKGKKGNGKRGIINVDMLSANFNDGDAVTFDKLQQKGLVSSKAGSFKVLARGTLNKALHVYADEFSLDAVKMIVLTGGTVTKQNSGHF